MKKVLVLYECSTSDWTYQEWKKNGLKVKIVFKKVNMFFRAIRRYWFKYNLPFYSLWYANWQKIAQKADMIIIHSSNLTMNLPEYINRINPSAKVIMWYWNAVNDATLPSKAKGNCELWSFDPENCQKYNMKYNHQYYFKSLVKCSEHIENDLYFCGEDAGRGKRIAELYNECKKQNLRIKMQIVNPKYSNIPKEIISNRVDYSEICTQIASSKAVLELTKEKQSGVTLRAMEALFFGKKLVTDNVNIQKEPFYNKNNCFILGIDPLDDLYDFINKKEFTPYDPNLIEKYDVKQWLRNFD